MKIFWRLGVWVMVLAWGATAVFAQTEPPDATPPLRVARLDATAYPHITLYLAAADPRQPLRADLVGVALRVDETPITNFSLAREAVGVDLIFVIDANESILSIDGEGQPTRFKKVQDALTRFATTAMDSAGLDRISVIVPEEADGRFLLQDANTPGTLVNGLLGYAPDRLGPTPLQEMLLLAVNHLQDLRGDHGRFQAIILLTDGAELDQQLDFATLVSQATELSIPFYAMILGARADPNEVANVTQLTRPTAGVYLHMPQPEAADPLFALWQAHGIQARLQYRAPQPVNGRSVITITQGSQQLSAEYALELLPPQLTLLLTPGALLRQGRAFDTPLADLTPPQQEVPVLLQWLDGVPRELVAISLLANDQLQVRVENPVLDSAGSFMLDWPLAQVDAGEVALVAEVEDAFGLIGRSDPVLLTVIVQRPEPPTPTSAPAPTAVSPVVLVETAVTGNVWLAAGLGGLALLLLLLIWLRRRRAAARAAALPATAAPPPLAADPDPVAPLLAFLMLDAETAVAVPQSPIPLPGDNVTIGRDPAVAAIHLDDPTISRLHARIRRRADDTYWLYDEGSATGTFLNHQRLGLAPRALEDGSALQFGQLRYIFRLAAMSDAHPLTAPPDTATPNTPTP